MIAADNAVEPGGRPPGKSSAAFRTIAEVAADLNLPSHVLRFWESKFPQIKPLKRRGGRRYYRPEDVSLLERIRSLLYVEGYTIRGVQRQLREGTGLRASSGPSAGSGFASVGPGWVAAEASTGAAGAACSTAPAAPPVEDESLLRALLAELVALRVLLTEAGD